MKQKNILLVEDDFLNRRLAKKILVENGYRILEANNTIEASELLKKEDIDLAVLDINLGTDERDGISIGKELSEKYRIPFVYLTAYDNKEIVTRAVATSPGAYITKPFKNTDLLVTIELMIRQTDQAKKHKPNILVKDGSFNTELALEEIDYIESEGNYLLFYSTKKIYKSRSTIKQILEVLPGNFIQVHRAYIVNKTKIEKFNTKEVVINQTAIPVSKTYVDHLPI
ncbi:putative transcriptional regulatory protein pdtaR [compost metagenome]